MPLAHDVITIFSKLEDVQVLPERQIAIQMGSLDLFEGHLFGGQVFSQAVHAAQLWLQSYKSPLQVHMSHGVFLKAGTPYKPLDFLVTPLGLGRTFQRLQVEVRQAGVLIYQSFVSAQRAEEPYIQHQQSMPQVDIPENLMTDEALKAKITGQKGPASPRPIQVRVATPENYLQAVPAETHHGFWFRYAFDNQDSSLDLVKLESSISLNQLLLAYTSDYGFLGGIFVPQDISARKSSYFLTSLDHSLWYYGDYQPDQWAYFEIESPVANHGRGSVFGKIYQQGRMIAIASQEGLIRRRENL